jgi:hypothetical protein
LSLQSDTDNVQFFQPPIDPTDPQNTVDTFINSTGNASVTIISGQRVVRATFVPGQIFVSLDLGDTPNVPHVGGRGVGFGSFSATAPGGIEPAYPLGIEDGTIDWGDIVENNEGIASLGLETLSTDLQHDVAFSGRGWVCPGFPDPTCPPATTPLKTDQGDLYLYQPYQLFGVDQSTATLYPDDSLSAGFFVADASDGRDDRTPAPKPAGFAGSSSSITYNAYVISDVTLGRQHFTGAQVYLSFEADTRTVVPFAKGGANGYVNRVGRARVTVISNGRSISADFRPGQLYVFYDVAHSNIGFGSHAGGIGYPLSLTDNHDPDGLTENSTLGAVSNLTKCTPPVGADYCYSDATAGLATDLTNGTALSGAASSCVSFDPPTSACTNLMPVPLHTTLGDFFLFEPYTAVDPTTDGSQPQPHTVNWGVFWTELAPHRG